MSEDPRMSMGPKELWLDLKNNYLLKGSDRMGVASHFIEAVDNDPVVVIVIAQMHRDMIKCKISNDELQATKDKLKACEEERDKAFGQRDLYYNHSISYNKKLSIAMEAVDYYGDSSNYRGKVGSMVDDYEEFVGENGYDTHLEAGKKAREAKKQIEEIE